jgi:hypothetical protein
MKRLWMICVLLLAVVASLHERGKLAAQPPTATPAPLSIASPIPTVEEIAPGLGPTVTWTPTPEGQVMIEALDVANVRAEADPNAAQLGQIRSGEQYVATGRYFEWIQFQFEPNRRGWVFGQLVNVTGDIASLPEIGIDTVVEDTEEIAFTEELTVLTQTPGGLLTATVVARQNATVASAPANADLPAGAGALPTFTYPPGLVAGGVAPTQDANSAIPTSVSAPPVAETTGNGIPPIVPILALGGLGVLGLAISMLRR